MISRHGLDCILAKSRKKCQNSLKKKNGGPGLRPQTFTIFCRFGGPPGRPKFPGAGQKTFDTSNFDFFPARSANPQQKKLERDVTGPDLGISGFFPVPPGTHGQDFRLSFTTFWPDLLGPSVRGATPAKPKNAIASLRFCFGSSGCSPVCPLCARRCCLQLLPSFCPPQALQTMWGGRIS